MAKGFAAEQRFNSARAETSAPLWSEIPTSGIAGNPSTLHKELKPGMCFVQLLVIQNRAV